MANDAVKSENAGGEVKPKESVIGEKNPVLAGISEVVSPGIPVSNGACFSIRAAPIFLAAEATALPIPLLVFPPPPARLDLTGLSSGLGCCPIHPL